jgi:transposase InsO family protein
MGYNCLFTDKGVEVSRREDSSIVFMGHLKNKLYLVDFNKSKAKLETCLVAKSSMGWLWLRRLAHVGMRNLAKLLKDEHILGLTNVHFKKDRVCSACQAKKQVGVPHLPKSIVSTKQPLELIHMDLFGPVAYISIGGNKYGLIIVDDYTRFTWVFFVFDKSQVQEKVKIFIRRAQREFNFPIKKVCSDNGTEFKNTYVEEFLDEEGIKHEFSTLYTPQQNSVVERKNQTLIDMARTMLDEYKTLDIFWCDAINTACHAINRLYLQKKLKKTSYDLLTGNKPKVSYFRVFGCKCFILNKKPKTSKFAPKVDECFLLGYGSNEHAYCVFNKTSIRVEIAVYVMFDESNGSQVEQIDASVVGNEEPPCEAIKQSVIGDIRPQQDKATEVEAPEVAAAPNSTDVPEVVVPHSFVAVPPSGSAAP